MKSRKYRISIFFRILAKVVIFIFARIFHVKANPSEEIRNINTSYLLLGTHVGFWDPFLAGYFLHKKPHFVASDGVLRDPIKRFFLKGFGVIGIKKNMRDTSSVRTMLSLIQNNEAIGLFPEAARTWTGNTLFIDPAVAKLVKLFNVPVVTAKFKGMFLFNPRWAHKLRKGKVEIDYQLIISKEELKDISADEIMSRIRTSLQHNEMEYQQQQRTVIQSEKRAEYLNHVIFYCPVCKSFHGFSAKGNFITCYSCGFQIFVDKFGFLEGTNGLKLPYNQLPDAFALQFTTFSEYIIAQFNNAVSDVLFSEKDMMIYQINEKEMYDLIGVAKLDFYIDRIEAGFENMEKMVFYISEIQSLNPQLRERIEVYYKNIAYRFEGKNPGVSGVKWEIACNAIWKLTNQPFKASRYFQ